MPDFEDGKIYYFDLVQAIHHSKPASPGWIAKNLCHLDGLSVRVIDKDTGACDGIMVVPDWCVFKQIKIKEGTANGK